MFVSGSVKEYHYNLDNATRSDIELATDNKTRERYLRQMDLGMLNEEGYNRVQRDYNNLMGTQHKSSGKNIPMLGNPWQKM